MVVITIYKEGEREASQVSKAVHSLGVFEERRDEGGRSALVVQLVVSDYGDSGVVVVGGNAMRTVCADGGSVVKMSEWRRQLALSQSSAA